MDSRLHAVFRTYTTRLMFWVLAGVWLVLHAVMLSGHGRPLAVAPFLVSNAAVGVMLGLQVKSQFANPRARLLPHFAATHLLAAGAIVIAAVLLDAWLLVWVKPVSRPTAAAFALALIAGVAWCWYSQEPVSSWLFAILVIAGCAAPQFVVGPIQQVLSGGYPVLSAGLACFGIAVLGVLAVRLRGLHEEMPEYSRRVPESAWDFTSRGAQRDRRRLEAEVIARATTAGRWYDLRFRLLLHWAGASGLWRRLLLRQLAGGFSGILLALFEVAIVFYLLWLGHGTPGASPGRSSVVLLSFFPMMMAMSMVGGVRMRQQPYLAHESLYPLGRAEFVRDLMREGACQTGIAAAGHCAGIVAGFAFFEVHGPVTVFMIPFLVLVVAQYAVVGCVMLWLASFRSFWGFVLGIELASMASAVPVLAAFYAGEAFWSPARATMAIAATAAVVILLHRITFRRWCGLELG
jgi:hypothetical protein